MRECAKWWGKQRLKGESSQEMKHDVTGPGQTSQVWKILNFSGFSPFKSLTQKAIFSDARTFFAEDESC